MDNNDQDMIEKDVTDTLGAQIAPEGEGDDVVFGLTDRYIQAIVEALRNGDEDVVSRELSDLSEADIAELIEKVEDEDRQTLLQTHGDLLDPYVFSELDSGLRRKVLTEMPARQVAALISEMDSDDALDLIIDLPDDFQHEVIRFLSAKTRITLEEGLNFPEESAGRLMQREFVAVPQFWTIGKTIDYLRAATEELPDEFFDLFVIDPAYHVVGIIPLNRVVRSKRSEKLEDLRLEDIHPIPATMDQEEVAQLFRRENLTSAPVVDESGRLIGVVTVDDIVDVIDEEAQEDFLKLGGVGQDDLYSNIRGTTRARFPWLFVNLFTAFSAAAVISLFSNTIEQLVALAALMPIVASMGGNAGTQALTVAVRALATRELSSINERRIVIKEILVGAINGCIFAILIGCVAGFVFSNPMLGVVIGMALIINLINAGLFGAGIPIVLNKLGADPAVASAVFLTTMTDIVGFFAFLGLATIFLL